MVHFQYILNHPIDAGRFETGVAGENRVLARTMTCPAFLPQFSPNFRRFSPFLNPDRQVSGQIPAVKTCKKRGLPSNSFGVRFKLALCPLHNSNSEQL